MRPHTRHVRTLAFLAPSAVAVWATIWGSNSYAADLQILTVGDSITAGFQYQPRLKTLLLADGHAVSFVGSQGTSPNLHEGFSGKGMYDFVGAIPLPNGASFYITTALNNAWPTPPTGKIPVVLVHLGINDLGHGLGRNNIPNAPLDGNGNCLAAQFFPADGGGSFLNPLGNLDGLAYGDWLKLRLNTLVDQVLAHPSQPRLVIAKILPIAKGNSLYHVQNDNCCERIKEWNGYWASKVTTISGPAAARITIVDCYTDAEGKRAYGAVPGTSFWGDATVQAGDWVHPNSAVGGGYTLMATKFKSGIDTLLGAVAGPSATWNGTTFTEDLANTGSIGNQLTITVTGDSFTGNNGDNLIAQGKVTVTNLPNGLTAVVTRTSATAATVSLNGNATAHANANDISTLTYVFSNSAVTSGVASAVVGLNAGDRRIDFSDAPVVGLLVAEPFNYAAAPGGLANQNSGTGWTSAWDGGANSVVAPGLSFNGFPSSANRSDINQNSFRSLPATISQGTTWVSFLAQSTTPGSEWGGLSLFNGGNEQLFIGQRFGSSVWGLEAGGNGVNASIGSENLAIIVVRLDLKSGLDDATLWINPTLGTIPSDNSGISFVQFGDLSANRIRLASGTTIRIDELRIGDSFAAVTPPASTSRINGIHIFYNNSTWDGNDSLANSADDAAIATDKSALLPGQTATFSHYTSYNLGINGIFVDIENLPGAPIPTDFQCTVGTSSTPGSWVSGPAPSTVSVRSGSGITGSDRITLVWGDTVIRNTWLKVTILANARTGLASPEIFYFGNAIGESGNSNADSLVNASDQLAARNSPRGPANQAPLNFTTDFNRDRLVNATDQLISRNNPTSPVTALPLFTAP